MCSSVALCTHSVKWIDASTLFATRTHKQNLHCNDARAHTRPRRIAMHTIDGEVAFVYLFTLRCGTRHRMWAKLPTRGKSENVLDSTGEISFGFSVVPRAPSECVREENVDSIRIATALWLSAATLPPMNSLDVHLFTQYFRWNFRQRCHPALPSIRSYLTALRLRHRNEKCYLHDWTHGTFLATTKLTTFLQHFHFDSIHLLRRHPIMVQPRGVCQLVSFFWSWPAPTALNCRARCGQINHDIEIYHRTRWNVINYFAVGAMNVRCSMPTVQGQMCIPFTATGDTEYKTPSLPIQF